MVVSGDCFVAFLAAPVFFSSFFIIEECTLGVSKKKSCPGANEQDYHVIEASGFKVDKVGSPSPGP